MKIVNFRITCIAVIAVVLWGACGGSASKDGRFAGFENKIDSARIVTLGGSAEIQTVTFPTADTSFFDFKNHVTDIRFIKLETTDSTKIGRIDKLFVSDKRIIAVDFNITEGIFIFDSEGHFIRKIAAQKKEERLDATKLMHIMDATFYRGEDRILVHDDKAGMLYYYDTNGKFQGKEKEYVSFFSFESIGSTDYFAYLDLYTQNDHISLLKNSDIYIGKKNTVITHIVPQARQRLRIPSNYHYQYNLSSGTSMVYYTPVFSDTVFCINGNPLNVYPKFVLRFPGATVSDKVRENPGNISMDQLNRFYKSHQYYSFRGKVLTASDSVHYFECYKDARIGYFYSERTRSLIGGNLKATFTANEAVKSTIFDYPSAVHKGEFIAVMPADMYGTPLSGLPDQLKDVKPHDNPVLLFYRIKPF